MNYIFSVKLKIDNLTVSVSEIINLYFTISEKKVFVKQSRLFID